MARPILLASIDWSLSLRALLVALLLAAGHTVLSAIDLPLWGALGQPPAAAVTAAAIVWLLARLDAAWSALIEAAPPTPGRAGRAHARAGGRPRCGRPPA